MHRIDRKGRKEECVIHKSGVVESHNRGCLAAGRTVYHRFPRLDHRSSNDQADNPLFLKVKKIYPIKYFQFKKSK